MPTRSLHDVLDVTQELQIATLNDAGSPEGLATGDIDTRDFDSVMLVVAFGDIDEMGGSPVGAAGVDIRLESAPDDGTGSPGTYAAVAASEVDGFTPDAGGTLTQPQTDTEVVRFSYIGANRFCRVTLTPIGLPNGGPVGVTAVRGHAHLTPTS